MLLLLLLLLPRNHFSSQSDENRQPRAANS
jgi:hypothetical protein